jgi:hypothetical protein
MEDIRVGKCGLRNRDSAALPTRLQRCAVGYQFLSLAAQAKTWLRFGASPHTAIRIPLSAFLPLQ